MERLLWLYSLPLDSRFPVVCFDERPCFLIGETVTALALKAGSVRKEHYEYAKNGSCALLAAIEPKTGKRLAQVYDQRCKREYALFLKELAAQYPAGGENPVGAGQLEHAQREFVVRNISGGRSLCPRTTLRVLLHAEESHLAQHARDRVLSHRPPMFATADCHESGTRTRGRGDCQRASRKSDQDRVAVFHRISANQVEPALRAGSGGECQIQRNLNYRVLSGNRNFLQHCPPSRQASHSARASRLSV